MIVTKLQIKVKIKKLEIIIINMSLSSAVDLPLGRIWNWLKIVMIN